MNRLRKRIARFLAPLLLLALSTGIFAAPIPATFTANSISTTNLETFRYWLYTPQNPTENMPLLIYLHGGSGKGDDLNLITNVDGFPKYLKDGELGSPAGYVVIPQLPASKKGWTDVGADLLELIVSVRNTYAISADKVSLTGHSMGGTGTWGIAAAYPKTFVRIAPCSGSIANSQLNVNKLKNVSVRAFVGSADTIVSPDASVSFVAALQEAGGDAALTVFEGADHFAVPALTYLDEDIDILDWLLFADCAHLHTATEKKLPQNGADGVTGRVLCTDCGKVLQEGTVIPTKISSAAAAEGVISITPTGDVSARLILAGYLENGAICSINIAQIFDGKYVVSTNETVQDLTWKAFFVDEHFLPQ